jgi:hypothetical protein
MKTVPGVLAVLIVLAAAAPAVAQHGGGFHGGGFHGGHFQGGHFHGGHFHHGHFHGAPFFGFGLGLGLGYGYPWYGYAHTIHYYDYPDPYPYSYPGYDAQPDPACGTWIWHPDTRSYGWLACGATSEVTVPTAAAPGVTPPAPLTPVPTQ